MSPKSITSDQVERKWCICHLSVVIVVLIVLALLEALRAGAPYSLLRDIFYAVALAVPVFTCRFVIRMLRHLDQKELDDILNQNTQLLAGAFALVVTVVLLIGQLGSALGMERAVAPDLAAFIPELLFFSLAIFGTMIGRWLSPGRRKLRAAVFSSLATLTCFLALAPYFWYQRQQIGSRAVVQSALNSARPHSCESFAPIERMLVGASVNGNYSLLHEGVAQLAAKSSTDTAYHECLVRLRRLIQQDFYGCMLVDEGLQRVAGSGNVQPEVVPDSSPTSSRNGSRRLTP